MAGGQHLSQHQKKIVNRYYQHLDTITLDKLAQATSELYLSTDPRKAAKLWKTVATALEKTAASDAQVKKILDTQDLKALAELIGKLAK